MAKNGNAIDYSLMKNDIVSAEAHFGLFIQEINGQLFNKY